MDLEQLPNTGPQEMQDSQLGIALGSIEESTCSIKIEDYSGDSVSVSYSGLPGNHPKDNKNFVAIWQASIIPWQNPDFNPVFIENNNEQGSLVLDGLTITKNSYIVGLSVGPKLTDICTSTILRAGGLVTAPTTVLIGLDHIGANSLTIHYETLAGYHPKTYNNWIGLWKGYASPYNPHDLVGTVNIKEDSNQGSIGMNNLQLGINTEYTLVYFMGKENTTAACILNFNTNDKP